MAQYLTLPNGDSVEVSDGLTYDEALARAQQKFPNAFKTPEHQRTGIGAALSKGFENVISSGRTGIESLLGNPEEAARRGLERGQTMAEKYPEQVSLEKVKKAYEERGLLPAAGEAISQVPAALAEQAPNMAATIAGARTGAALGSLFGIPGKAIGAGLGAAVPSLAQMFGSNIERQASEQQTAGKPVEINRGAAALAAVPQAALDVAGQYIPLGSKLVSKLIGIPEAALVSKSAGQVQKLADEKLYATLAKGLGTGVMAEVPTEVAQQMLERAQAGLSLTSPDALKEYGETAYQVSLLAPLGSAGRTFQRGAARSEVRQKQDDEIAAERDRLAQEQEKATQALVARRGTDDYAREIEQKYKDMAAKQLEYETISKGKVADDDLLGQQAKKDARRARKDLLESPEFKDTLAEYSQLKTSGIYDKLAEKDRIAGMTPEEYALAKTQEVTLNKTKAVEPDLGGYYEQQILAPGALDLKQATDYAKQQFALLDDRFHGLPSAEQTIEYLAQNPRLATQLVENKVRLPGMSAKDSKDTLNDLKQLLGERQAQATAQGRAGTELNKARVNTVEEEEAAALQDQRQMRQAYEMQQEGRNATDIERIQGQKPTFAQGELFGGEQQRVNMPQTGTRVDIDAQIADLEKQLDVAKSYGAPDAISRRSNRERQSTLMEQIRDLKDRQAKMAAGTPMGEASTNAVGEAMGISLPEQEAAQREAATARDAAYEKLKGGNTDARQDVLDNLVKGITAARGKLRPETITQIETQANALMDRGLKGAADITPAFEALSARWRAGTQTGTYGAAQGAPTTTTQDMLLKQMDTAFGQRERYDPQTLSILDQLAQNFGAVSANEDRRNMVGEWLNRVSTTGRSSPEMTRDVQNEMATLERAKISETETPTRETAFGTATKPTRTAVQQELGAEFMPEQIAPQAATRIVNGKVQYVAPEDRGPLQGSAAERYAPTQKGTVFESFEELDKYLASDYLKEARENQGLARETVARLSRQVTEYETKITEMQKQLDALQERKTALKELQASERRAASDIIADVEVQLTDLIQQLQDDLSPIQFSLEQAETNLAAAEARSEETSRLIANNAAQFTQMDDRVVLAAQATADAKAELRKARNKLGSLDEKRPLIEAAQRKVIEALQRQRNPLLHESQQKLQDLQAKLEKARELQPRTAARLEQEIANLEDKMDVQRDNPYVPSSAMVTFLNNDMQLYMDAREDHAKVGAAKRAVIHFQKKLDKAKADLDITKSTNPKVKALQEQVGTAKTLAFDSLRNINKDIDSIDEEIRRAENAKTEQERNVQHIEDDILATAESRSFAAQMASIPTEPMSAAERDRIVQQDRKRLEESQESTARLEALPGQRIDFSKRQELLELASISNEDLNNLDSFIEEMETGVEEMQVRVELAQIKLDETQDQAKSYRGPRKNLAEAKPVFAQIEQLQKQIEAGQERIDTLRKSIEDFQKARARKEAAIVAAQRVTSSDPEVYAEVTKVITARSDRLERTIAKKQDNIVKKGQEITALARDIKAKDLAGKTSPEQLAKMRARLKTLRDSQADRAKGYKGFLKERAVLQAQRSNRLGITRTDVLTGQKVSGERGKQASVTEQEQFDAEIDRVQELGQATDRMAVLDKALAAMQKAAAPKTEAKQAERAEKIAKLQADINAQQALIDSLQPKQTGKVSQAAREQSAAPGKLRAGTPESKENAGITRQPIVEKRELAPPPSEKAVAEANAFVARVNAAKTPKELDAEFAAKSIEAQNQILEAMDSNIERLTVLTRNIANELYDLNLIPKNELKPFHANNRDKLRNDLKSAERVLDQTLLAKERYLAEQEKAEVAETGDEGVGLPSGYTSFTGKDIIGNEDTGFFNSPAYTQGGTKLKGPVLPVTDEVQARDARVQRVFNVQADYTSPYHGKTYAEAAALAAKNATDPLIKEAFQVLADSLATQPVHDMHGRVFITDKAGFNKEQDFDRVTGLFDTNMNLVIAPSESLSADAEIVLLHELSHAATFAGLQTDSYLKGRVTSLRNRVDAWLKTPEGKAYYEANKTEISRGTGEGFAAYGLTDNFEFLAEVYSNKAFQNMLRQIPSDTPRKSVWQRLVDAFAEFFNFSSDAQKSLLEDALEVTDRVMAKTEQLMQDKAAARAGLARPLAAPRYANTTLAKAGAVANKTIATQRGIMATIKEEGAGLKLMTNFVDRFAPLEKLSKYMDSLKGLQMMYYTRMYDQRMNFVAQSVGNGALQVTEKKRADGRTERIVESVGGASLKGVVNVLKKGNDLVGSPEGNSRLFSMYLLAKRAERVGLAVLNYGGKVTEADLKDVRDAVANTPGLKAIYDQAQREYNMYNRDMLQFAVESGAISAATREKLIQSGDYVPYYRERNGGVDMMLGSQSIARIGNTKDQPYLKELTGGDEPILDFMTSAVQNTNMLTDMALRNLATKNAVFELQEIGMATIGKGDGASGPNVVRFKDKGEDKFAMVHTEDVVVGGKRFPTGIPADLVVKGMAGIPTQNTILTKMLGGPARALRKAVVLNPLYAAKQLFRDSLAAPLLSGADFAPVFGALKEIGTVAGKTLEQRGITGGQVFTGTQEDLAMVLRDMAANKSGWAQGLAKLESMSMEADALTRRAQYNSYIKQGLSEMEATYMALESMNFAKRGVSPAIHTLSTIIPFFNAQIQSMNVLFKAFSGNMPFNEKLKIREKLYQRGMMIAAMTMTYAALMQDDEGYQNATPEQKYGNWFIHVPGVEEAVRIPIPFEIGYIFKALPEAIVNMMMNQDGGEEAAKAFKQIALQIIPGGSSYGMPQAIKPLLEAGLGKSFYTGRDLESAHEQTLEPGQRFRDTTTDLAKIVGKAINVSPIKIDSLIQGYFSSTGLALVDSLSFAIPTEAGPQGATKRLSEMRLVGGLFQPKDASGIINATYDRLQEAAQVKATYQDMLAKGRTNEAQRYLQENLNAYAESGLQTSFKSYMQGMMKSENAIKASDLPPDEKRRILDEYKHQKIEFAKSVREQSDRTRLQ